MAIGLPAAVEPGAVEPVEVVVLPGVVVAEVGSVREAAPDGGRSVAQPPATSIAARRALDL